MALKLDSQSGALSIEIRPRKTWLLLPNLLFLVIWCWGVEYVGVALVAEIKTHGDAIARLSFGLLVTLVISIACVYYFAQALFGRDAMEVSPSTLTVRSIILGFVRSRKEFANQLVRNLRYEEWPGGRAGRQNGVRFEYGSETFTFARQASEQDSWAMIDQMCTMYKFSTPAPERSPAVVD